jgi:hypothetical protein
MQRLYPYVAAVLVTLFLASVARFYHPDTGFTSLIGFSSATGRSSPILRGIPHVEYPPSASYDGQYYAQRAFDPLVRSVEIDRVTDLAPFRARRILFSWTAYVLGLGHPPWILEAYALQNVVCWLLLAVILMRWVRPTSARGLALWTACLFSHGMMWSVRFSLLDGPSMVLIACAVALGDAGRPLASAAVVGVSGLARETNLLAAAVLPLPAGRRDLARLAVAGVLVIAPVVVWYDYLWSIYRSTLLDAPGSLVLPGVGMTRVVRGLTSGVQRHGWSLDAVFAFALLVSVTAQALFVFVRRTPGSSWWRIAAAYATLMLCLAPELIAPRTGAITRVLLPLTVGFNILLGGEARRSRFWTWFAVGNLHLLPALRVMPLLPW